MKTEKCHEWAKTRTLGKKTPVFGPRGGGRGPSIADKKRPLYTLKRKAKKRGVGGGGRPFRRRGEKENRSREGREKGQGVMQRKKPRWGGGALFPVQGGQAKLVYHTRNKERVSGWEEGEGAR